MSRADKANIFWPNALNDIEDPAFTTKSNAASTHTARRTHDSNDAPARSGARSHRCIQGCDFAQ